MSVTFTDANHKRTNNKTKEGMDTRLVWWLEELRSEVEGSISTPSIMQTITNNINIGCLKEKKRNQNVQNHNFL